MDKDVPPEKLRCVVVRPDIQVPGCICVCAGEDGDVIDLKDESGKKDSTQVDDSKFDTEEDKFDNQDDEERSDDILSSSGSDDSDSKMKKSPPKKPTYTRASYSRSKYRGYGDYLGYDPYGRYGGDEYGGDFTRMYDLLGRDEDEGGEEEGGQPFEDYMRFFLEVEEPCVRIPSLSSSEVSCVEPILQRTIAIVKPEAMVYKDVILRAIFEAGFQITGRRIVHLTPEQVSEIYAKHYGSPSFPHLVLSVSSGPVLVMALAALDVISKWKKMIGPDGSVMEAWFFPLSMRKRFGLQRTVGNSLHGSENLKESNRENRYFFPDSK